MKVLLIDGSARGLAALEAAAEALRESGAETERFFPVRTRELMCSGCGACKGAGMCIYDPRGQDFVRAAADCDALLLAAPCGLFGLDVDVKNLLERAASLTQRRADSPFAGKAAAALLIGRRSVRAEAQLRALLASLGLPLPEGVLPAVRGEGPEAEAAVCALARRLSGRKEQNT